MEISLKLMLTEIPLTVCWHRIFAKTQAIYAANK